MADANQEKGIWIFTHDEVTGIYIDKEFISTEHIVTPITSYEIKEGDEIPELNPNARNYVTLEGKSAWITKTKKKLKDCNIKVKPTDRAIKKITSDSMSISKYLEDEFEPIAGVEKEEIREFLRQL